jgi:hypothetical protein
LNCRRFRRQLFIDPQCRDAEFLRHAEVCPDCGLAARRALDFESKLFSALQQETETSADTPRNAKRRTPLRLTAITIALVLLIGAALLFFWRG